MLVVGLTGGIGSGKSAVSRRFAQRGVPVIDADVVAREVVAPGEPALGEIAAAFGEEVLATDGSLDRARLRERVFVDTAARERLEAILHPHIRARMRALAGALPEETPYAVMVIPLLLEAGQRDMVDRVLVVEATEAARIARVASRDRVPADQVRRIVASQCTDGERAAAADDVILNAGTESELDAKVSQLHEKYLALARPR